MRPLTNGLACLSHWRRKSRLSRAVLAYVGSGLVLTVLTAVLAWTLAPPTGLIRTLYPNPAFAGQPLAQDRSTDISLGFLDDDPRLPRTQFSVLWRGFWYLPRQEAVQVQATGGETVEVYLDRRLILRRESSVDPSTASPGLNLAAGPHELIVRCQHGEGSRILEILQAGTGRTAAAFPPSQLFYRKPNARDFRTVSALRWLEHLVVAVWLIPPALALLVLGGRACSDDSKPLGRFIRRGYARSQILLDRYAKPHTTLLQRSFAILGLVALAIVQPTFEVVSKSPEFLVARNTTFGTACLMVAVVFLALPGALIVILVGLQCISKRIATAFFWLVLSALGALLVLPLLKQGDSLDTARQFGLAAAVGMAVAWAHWRVPLVRQFLTILAVTTFAVPAVFLYYARVTGAFVPENATMAAPDLKQTPTIVMVVFDEFPLNSLLDENRAIDPVRYPNLSALAKEAYWFPNASAVSSQTVWAVPAIVSGRYPTTPNAVPTLRYYPNNLFTFLSGSYEMTLFGRFLQLCPSSMCHYDLTAPPDTVAALVSDLFIVWLHIVLPDPLTNRLPPVVGDWQGFAQNRLWRSSDGVAVTNDRNSEFERFLTTIDGHPTSRLYFLHSLLPHMPFEYVPSGRRYRAPDYQDREEDGERLFVRASAEYANSLYQRHLLQVGFVDRLIGKLVRRLKQLGIYDSTLLILTADHGASFQDGVPRRTLTDDNVTDIMLVPLLVKVPGHQDGVVSYRNVEAVDILPTVAKVMGVDLPFKVDGRPVFSDVEPERTAKTFVRRNWTQVNVLEVSDWTHQRKRALERKLVRFGSGDMNGLYSVPGTESLLGKRVDKLVAPDASGVRVNLEDLRSFDNVEPTKTELPLYVSGTVETAAPARLRLAIAVNDVVVTTATCHKENGAWVLAAVIPETSLRRGSNKVRVFVIEERRGGLVLRTT